MIKAIERDIASCRAALAEYLIKRDSTPPWEFNLRPDRVWRDTDGMGLNKEWVICGERWSYWEPIKVKRHD